MASETGFWARFADEVRSVTDRTRRGAQRAVQMGVLRVDLVSLRRDRTRALADLGERVLTLWRSGTPEAIESDPEALRLRSRVASIDELSEAKRAELERLREEAKAKATAGQAEAPAV